MAHRGGEYATERKNILSTKSGRTFCQQNQEELRKKCTANGDIIIFVFYYN